MKRSSKPSDQPDSATVHNNLAYALSQLSGRLPNKKQQWPPFLVTPAILSPVLFGMPSMFDGSGVKVPSTT